jgi:DNA-binding MarR family transcriptional regulator
MRNASKNAETTAAVERAMVRIRRSQTRRALGKLAERELGRPLALSRSFVVDALDESADEPASEVAVGAVAERLGIDPSRASRMVAEAIEAGDVVRVASQSDGRRSLLRLTEQGRALARTARKFRLRMFDRAMDGWTVQERAEFARLLTKFTDSVNEARLAK